MRIGAATSLDRLPVASSNDGSPDKSALSVSLDNLSTLGWRHFRPTPRPALISSSVIGAQTYRSAEAVPHTVRSAVPAEHFLNYEAYESRRFAITEVRDVLITRDAKAVAAPGLGLIDDFNVGGAEHMPIDLLHRDMERRGGAWWTPDRSVERVEGFSIPLCHYGGGTFGHFVLDALLQVYIFRRELATEDARLVHWPFPNGWMVDVLSACGAPGKARRELRKSAALLQRAGLSSALAAHGVYFPCSISLGFFDWLRHVFDAPLTAGRRRLYLRRSPRFGRAIANATDLETLVASHGYEAISPETLSFDEQIRLVASAGSLISAWGSGLTLAPLLGGARHVLELLPLSVKDAWFIRQAMVHRLNYDPLIVNENEAGECIVDLAALDRQLTSVTRRLG